MAPAYISDLLSLYFTSFDQLLFAIPYSQRKYRNGRGFLFIAVPRQLISTFKSLLLLLIALFLYDTFVYFSFNYLCLNASVKFVEHQLLFSVCSFTRLDYKSKACFQIDFAKIGQQSHGE